MILAAGLGTRLRPLTDRVPKPLVPVGDAPMIAHVIKRLRGAGATPIVANAFHHTGELAAYCATQGVSVSEESDLLGTAGGIAHAARLLGEGDVLVHNGDVLATVDLASLVSAHASAKAAATLAVVPGPSGAGNVGSDAQGRVVRLRKETFAAGEVSGGEFTGIHVVSPRVRRALPAKGCIVGDVYMPRLRVERDLYVQPAADLVDIGSIAGYREANVAWLRRRGLRSWVGAGAHVAETVALEDTVVGDGARVTGDGALVRCVVWPGESVTAPATDTVFAYSTQVR
jgi:mannose-1-phosphate guanylyltransferase